MREKSLNCFVHNIVSDVEFIGQVITNNAIHGAS